MSTEGKWHRKGEDDRGSVGGCNRTWGCDHETTLRR